MCMTKYTYIIPVAPPDFDHAMREAAYQMKRANRLNPTVANNATVEMDSVNTDGERAIAPRCPSDVAEGKIPNGGFSGS